jgi:B12-binding domain/radical SAM domain protein
MASSVFIANCGHGGATALNVLSAALGEDLCTADTDVVFVDSSAELVPAIRRVSAGGAPAVVGWSFCSQDFECAAIELQVAREEQGEATVWHVAGGPHASADPDGTLRAGFDLCAIGEGEAIVVELIAALQEGRDPKRVPGIASLNAGRVVTCAPPPARPLDELPAFNARCGRINPLEITRGCAYRCAFCQTPRLFPGRPRHRSVDNVRRNVAELRKMGVRYVRFVTPNALGYGTSGRACDLGALEELLAAVREASGPHTKIYLGTFPSEVRPDQVSSEALALLRRTVANRDLAIGVQSGSQRVLDRMRRGYSVEQARRAVECAIAAGFRPQVDLIFGYPGETPSERAETVALAEELGVLGVHIRGHSFMPLPGTELADAVAEPMDAGCAARLAQLESVGVLHGPWRRQGQGGKGLACEQVAAGCALDARAPEAGRGTASIVE